MGQSHHSQNMALHSVREVCHSLGHALADSLPHDAAIALTFLRTHHAALSKLSRQCGHALHKQQRDGSATCKAAAHTARERDGWISVTLPVSSESNHLTCSLCSLQFSTKAALASHRSSRHGVGLLCGNVSGTACPVCRQQWWTTWRLKEHLRRSEVCRNAWNHADLSPPCLSNLQASDLIRHRSPFGLPCDLLGTHPSLALLSEPVLLQLSPTFLLHHRGIS